jgi:biopolymer transport protein ExbD
MTIEAEDDTVPSQEGVVAEINMTPLTDVFLVLLIIALGGATSVVDATRPSVEIRPPRSQDAAPLARQPAPVLTVTRAGEVYLDRTPVDRPRLEAAIRKALADAATGTVLLRGDTGAQLGLAVQVMATARKAGATNIQVLAASP